MNVQPTPLVYRSAIKRGKRIIVAVVSGTVLAVGLALVVLPGPAFIVIPAGLAILAMEFAWARRWLRKARGLCAATKFTRATGNPFLPADGQFRNRAAASCATAFLQPQLNEMKTTLRYLGLNAQAAWNRLVQEHLNLLKKLADIESAEVVLERQRNGTPAFRARVVLVVAGPDFHAEAVDHTPAAAVSKTVQNLKRQIQARQTRRRVNGKSNLQLGTNRRFNSFYER